MQITLPDELQQYLDEVIADRNQPDNVTDVVEAAFKMYYNNWKLNEITSRIAEEKETYNQTKDEEQATEITNSLLN